MRHRFHISSYPFCTREWINLARGVAISAVRVWIGYSLIILVSLGQQLVNVGSGIQEFRSFSVTGIGSLWTTFCTLSHLIFCQFLYIPRTNKERGAAALSSRTNASDTIYRYTRVNKNPSAWNFPSPKPEVTCGTVAIIIRVVLLSTYLRIRAVSLSSIHYNHTTYILTEDDNTFA